MVSFFFKYIKKLYCKYGKEWYLIFPSLWHCSETLCHNYNGQFKIYDALHNLLPHFSFGFFFCFIFLSLIYRRDEHLKAFQMQAFKVIIFFFLSLCPDSPPPSKIENFWTSQCLWRDWIYVWLTFKIKCYCRKCQKV